MIICKWFETLVLSLALTSGAALTTLAHADVDSAVGEVKQTAKEAGTGLKKAGRAIKDKGCKMVKGELQCAVEKGEHKVKNAADDVKDKVTK